MTNKKIYSLYLVTFFLVGCDNISIPGFSGALSDANNFIQTEKAKSAQTGRGYVAKVRTLKPYKEYHMAEGLTDPFAIKKFLTDEELASRESAKNTATIPSNTSVANKDDIDLCKNGCPDFERKKTFLEHYELSRLGFVGRMKGTKNVALIETPDIGVIQARQGEFIGRDYGRIIDINEGALIIQEKVLAGGIWQDRKVVLKIQ